MTNTPSKNPFDFTDLSDLPPELASKLNTETDDMAREYAAIVAAGAEAGHPELTINHIIAAATRMGKEVPTAQTVRGYLNKAVDLGLIVKPTRQSYGAAVEAVDGGETPVTKPAPKAKAEAVVSADPVVTSDPLADI